MQGEERGGRREGEGEFEESRRLGLWRRGKVGGTRSGESAGPFSLIHEREIQDLREDEAEAEEEDDKAETTKSVIKCEPRGKGGRVNVFWV